MVAGAARACGPGRARRGRETGVGVAVVTQQPGEVPQTLVIHALGPARSPGATLDEGQNFTPSTVDSQRAGRMGEADLLQVPQ